MWFTPGIIILAAWPPLSAVTNLLQAYHYRELLNARTPHLVPRQFSHSRRGECYDNTQAKSLWARLKTELLKARDWPVFTNLADTQASVADYSDYYNHKRRHSLVRKPRKYSGLVNRLSLS